MAEYERIGVPADGLLVRWEECWIDPALLTRLREHAARLADDPQLAQDLLDLIAEHTAGKDVRTLDDLPARAVRLLHLAP